MREADKMFEELDYVKEENEKAIIYKYDHELIGMRMVWDITFWKPSEMIFFHTINGLDKKTLEAINTKYKELGWFDE